MRKIIMLTLLFFITSHLNAHEVVITTPQGPIKFQAELAQSESEKAKGLMFRTDLKPKNGMLFLMNPEDPTAMWMKNTPLSLDMLFITPEGVISHIAESTKPYSTKMIGPYKNVGAVFEVPAGTFENLGIQIGHKVSYELFQ